MSKKQDPRFWRLWNLRYTKRVLAADPNSQMSKSLFLCWGNQVGDWKLIKAQRCQEEIQAAVLLWRNSGGVGEPSPAIMQEVSTAGFYITAIPPGEIDAIVLTWPCVDLEKVFIEADKYSLYEYNEIIIYEDDFGIPLEEFTQQIRNEILDRLTRSNGEEILIMLMDEYID